ncbi:epidermal growth factor receptor-like isoform X2 [Tigriopus californicus]|uniref:epidermal growth factor receptor-like isoform X2 n=1 Tax=Tigriopus californicus TaxID=6832 RepID=UPI0027DA19DA|nr:epidermal growth factor receptor-like isoform X2 [Tigriopus californicus]
MGYTPKTRVIIHGSTLGILMITLILLGQNDLAQGIRLQEKVCIGTSGRMSVPNNREHHYRNLRDRYTNCTYVDGNLELTWLQDENLDLSFLQHIREVTGYVLISHVDVTRIVLPSLQIIRGRTLFKLSVQEDEFALIVTLSKMHNLELPALRDILDGSVGIMNNYNLCHIKTIEWKEIITGQNAKYLYVYKFAEPERDCTPCHESCQAGCWGEGPHNCQKFSKINCSPQCHGGRCFGPKPRECCHLFCAGGCTGPKQSDCLACRNFYDDGVCKQECPPMQRYNPIKYKWERNPDGKYAYGATCVKDCPKHLLKDNGACVRACPPKKKNENGECVPCEGPCPKTCHFSDTIHAGNINLLQNCTVIEGSLTILDSSFHGFQQIYDNFTFGPRYPALDPAKLDVLSTLREVTGYLNIQAHHPNFKNLDAFRNLEIVGGRTLTEYFSSLYVVKTSLTSLNLKSLRKIRSGSVAILENQDLCFASKIKWQKIMKSPSHNTLLQNNKDPQMCITQGFDCDRQCSAEGCWGPGNKLCLSCKNYQVEDECVASCDPNLGMFRSGENECMKCDAQCELTCTGSGPGKCDRCRTTKDGPFCVDKCPAGKYDDRAIGECRECHSNCVGGCNGPENTVGPNGCNSCEKAILNTDLEVVRCLKEADSCPDGYFYEWVVPQVEGKLQSLSGKAICRPCHPLCKRCNGYGFHQDVCHECYAFEQDEQCVTECSSDYFADQQNKKCKPCANECRGCYGPSVAQCHSCKNYKLFPEGADPHDNTTAFSCTKTCPDETPHKIFTDQGEEPYCSVTPNHMAQAVLSNANSLSAIIGGVVGCILLFGIFIVVFGYQWRQRARAKENTAKMTMVMTGYEDSEPLRPTNIKPNLAKLKIVREQELRKGGILGYGAFGTVYKGVWVPEGENVKIPVAVKVLREGTGTSANKEILEEAYIMASVEHPNLLQLLAVCMTSQMMLVTQLMPLGCLLDYVRNNKDKIGSKPLLNWCTQIARGMAYLEERRLVHRDLAARNVLVQTPSCVKITDFGLAKLLDINEDEYKAAGGKMPIKWLALECIQHRIFNHKSDVWAFGVTVWELLTYGERPYDNIPAREVPDLLEKGERLRQPVICSLEVYMILIKCWQVDADARPNFTDLAKEFAKMAQDPGRYLVIPGDKLMRLPSYTTQDEKELIRNISSNLGGSEMVMAAEEYLNPGRMPSQHTLHTPVDTPLPTTPTQKFFPPNFPPPSYHDSLRGVSGNRPTRYGSHHTVHEGPGASGGFNTLGTRSLRYGSNFFSASCDPLKLLEDDNASSMPNGYPSANTLHSQKSLSHQGMNTASRRGMAAAAGLRLELPVDEEDYLVPSPQSPAANSAQGPNNHTPTLNNNVNAYMDLLSGGSAENGNGKSASNPSNSTNTNTSNSNTMFPYPPPQGYFLTDNPSNYGRVPDFTPFANTGLVSMDNPEYILNEHRNKSNRGNYHTLGIPLVNGGSPGPSSIQSAPGGNGNNPPYTSLPGGNPRNGYSSVPPGTTSGLNGVINGMAPGVPRTPGVSSHPRSSAGEESDEHEYYNDFDRLKREMQPLHPNRTSTASSSNGSVVTANLANGPPGMLSLNPASSNINKHETTV